MLHNALSFVKVSGIVRSWAANKYRKLGNWIPEITKVSDQRPSDCEAMNQQTYEIKVLAIHHLQVSELVFEGSKKRDHDPLKNG